MLHWDEDVPAVHCYDIVNHVPSKNIKTLFFSFNPNYSSMLSVGLSIIERLFTFFLPQILILNKYSW